MDNSAASMDDIAAAAPHLWAPFDETTAEEGPVPPDAELAQAVREVLAQQVRVLENNVCCGVSGGWAVLVGRVDTEQQRAAAQRAALAIAGIEGVEDHLFVGGPRPATLRVVSVHGDCPLGYRRGDAFLGTASGELSPVLCPVAGRALRPLVAEMVKHPSGAMRQIACPVYDHMLVLERVKMES